MKLLLSIGTALLLSGSAFAVDAKTMNLEFSPGSATAQMDQYYSYNFGTTSIRMPRYADFSLNNKGPGELSVHQIAVSGMDYDAYDNCPQVLAPKLSCIIRVRFSPWTEGYKTGRLYIQTDDGRILIDLIGWGSY